MRNLLRHAQTSCKGAVVLDVSPSVKLVAPAFEISVEGIGTLLLDVVQPENGTVVPSWECRGCGQKFHNDKIHLELEVECSVCGHVKPLNDMFLTKTVPSVCSVCMDELKDYAARGVTKKELIQSFAESYGINRRTAFTPLADVLKKPFQIR